MATSTQTEPLSRLVPGFLRPGPNHDDRDDCVRRSDHETEYLYPANRFRDRHENRSGPTALPPDPGLIGPVPVNATLTDDELRERADRYGLDLCWQSKGIEFTGPDGVALAFRPVALSYAIEIVQDVIYRWEKTGRLPRPAKIGSVRVYAWRAIMLAQLIAYEEGVFWDPHNDEIDARFQARVSAAWLAMG